MRALAEIAVLLIVGWGAFFVVLKKVIQPRLQQRHLNQLFEENAKLDELIHHHEKEER